MTKLADVLRRVEENASGLPSTAPAAPGQVLDLRATVHAAVRSAAEGVRRRIAGETLPAEPSKPATPPPEVEIAMMQDQTIVMIEEAPAMEGAMEVPEAQEAPAEPPAPMPAPPPTEARPVPEPEEERQALEAALGIQAAAPLHDTEELANMVELEVAKSEAALPRGVPAPRQAAPQKGPSGPASQPITRPPAPPRPAPAAEEAPVSATVRTVSFCWTALVRTLTLIDRVVPTRLRACKPLFGRVGVALTGFAVVSLAAFAVMILRG